MVAETGPIRLRHATPEDHAGLSEVCLRTGADGEDARGREDDESLLGLIFAVPYQVFAPRHARVLEDDAGLCGYVLGTEDSAAMHRWLTEDWFPRLRTRIADPGPNPARWRGSDWARRHIHDPPSLPAVDPARYPAHGHIDLLPRARGKGWGRRAMEVLMEGLAQAGAPGLYLEVSPRNANAQAFYRRLGFRVAQVDQPDTVVMVRDLGLPPG